MWVLIVWSSVFLTIVLLLGCEPFARRDVIWEHDDCDDSDQYSSAAFDHEKDSPRFEFDVDEGDTVGDDAVDEAAESC